MKNLAIPDLVAMKQSGEKIACLTCYDASFAAVLDTAGVDVQLVGDSLGVVIHGSDSTLGVKMADMIYHARLVSQTVERGLIVVDMPFMTYNRPHQALGNAGRLMREGGAQMVKLEGGEWLSETIRLLVSRGIPVCGHLGLLPQSVNELGGYKVQGRDEESARELMKDARVLQEVGASMLVLECVPRNLATRITDALEIPVIGIGAGADCDGQVLVLHDMLGISGKKYRFLKDFMQGKECIADAIRDYVGAVKAGEFPAARHGFD